MQSSIEYQEISQLREGAFHLRLRRSCPKAIVSSSSSYRVVAILWLAICATTASFAADVQAIAQAVDDHYNHMRTLQAEFSEIYRGTGTERTETGTLWLKKPGKMRWEYSSPEQKLFLSDGQSAWFYLPQARQARKTPVKQLDDLRSPLGLLLGKTRLEKELQPLSLAPDVSPLFPGDVVLRGVPKALADRANQVILEVTADYRIIRIIVDGTDDSVTEYRFSGQKENILVPDQRFQFTPPAGVEVMSGNLGQ
jgi:outer membrane lipoprotein carrier protein